MSSHEQAVVSLLSNIALSIDGAAVLGLTLAYAAVRTIVKFTSSSSALRKLQDAPSFLASDLRSVLDVEGGSDSSSRSEREVFVIVRGTVMAKWAIEEGQCGSLRQNVLYSHISGDRPAVIIQRTQTIPFVLLNGRALPVGNYVVVNMDGSKHHLPLTTVFQQLQPIDASPCTFLQAHFGHEYPVALLDEEKILPIAKHVTAVGRCFLKNGIRRSSHAMIFHISYGEVANGCRSRCEEEALRLKSAVAGLSVIRFPLPLCLLRRGCLRFVFRRGGLLIAQGRARSLFDRPVLSESEKKGFIDIASRYLSGKALPVEWSKIQAPTDEFVVPYDSLAPVHEVRFCVRPDIVLFSTDEIMIPKIVSKPCGGQDSLGQTRRFEAQWQFDNNEATLLVPCMPPDLIFHIFERHAISNVDITSFKQSRYPYLDVDDFMPLPCQGRTGSDGWARNMFLLPTQVTPRMSCDKKGGSLISYEGKVHLLEIAQVPDQHVSEFQSTEKFKNFNTNNLWVNLKAIQRLLEAEDLKMDIIPIQKEANGTKVLQLETAAGAAIEFFDNAIAINVPRSRFIPLKATSDMLEVQSDLHSMDGGLVAGRNSSIKSGPEREKVESFRSMLSLIYSIKDNFELSGNLSVGSLLNLKGFKTKIKLEIQNGGGSYEQQARMDSASYICEAVSAHLSVWS
ncbi:hypothetical protein NL676_028231 [Syzygium grande]|nr:hypothetical protein NL676_028231 [Syzygium grande]